MFSRIRAFSRGPIAPLPIAAIVSALASTAAAQTPTPTEQPATQKPAVISGWNDGFFVQSADGDYRLQLGVTLQTDGRFSLDDPAPITNTFVLRKARPIFGGRIARYFDFRLMPEFAGGSTTLLDANFDIRFSTKLRVRTGKDKTPIGYEVLIGDTSLIFPERTLVSSLLPSRDVGFQAIGDLAGGKIFYSGGVFNGQVDGTNNITDVDTNAGKDLAGRVVVFPFRSTATAQSQWNNFGFHLGGSTGSQSGALPSFRTSAQQTYFSYVTGTTADGTRNRVTPAVFLYVKSFGGFAEYARSSQEALRGTTRTTIANQAWGVTASYVLTGEPTSDRGVRPSRPFDPAAGQWGALQVAARYSQLTVDDAAFAAGLATEASSREAHQWTIAANWYPTNYTKAYATFERTTFDGGSRESENVILFRMQFAF